MVKKYLFFITLFFIFSMLSLTSAVNTITLKGKIVDGLTKEPIEGARLISAYEFSPSEVVTGSDGIFEFTITDDFKRKEGAEAGFPDVTGAYNFYDSFSNCYNYAQISLQKNYEYRENGQDVTYNLALMKFKFDNKESVADVSEKNIIDVGNLEMYPAAGIEIHTDIPVSFTVQYKYKNLNGFNGGGNARYEYDHSLSSVLPLDYDVFIQFEDEQGGKYESSNYHVPLSAKCGTITLDWNNRQSDWSLGEKESYIELDIKKGWNLIPLIGIANEIFDSSSIKSNDIEVQWLYIPLLKKHFKLFPEDQQKLQSDFLKYGADKKWFNRNSKYLLNSGSWIYSKKDGKFLISRLSDYYSQKYKEVGLNAGWNLKVITKSMANKKFEEIKGTCNIQKVAMWDPIHQKWEVSTDIVEVLDSNIESRFVNTVIALKVSSDCMFGDSLSKNLGNNLSLPLLPN